MPVLARYAKEGWAIISAIPSCTLMFKQELPLMFPDCANTQAVKAAVFDPFEYLIARHKDGLLKTDFKAALGRVSYHIPCHGRVQNIGRKTEEMFKLIDRQVEVKLTTVEDLARENDEKTSAVHFLRFEFNPAQRQAVRAGAAVKLGCDPTRTTRRMW